MANGRLLHRHWIFTTVSKAVFDIVRRPRTTAFSLWHAIEGLFLDNELQRAFYFEAELCSTQQGDLSINDYYTKFNCFAEQLRDIGHPISKASHVLNLLRGLNPCYRLEDGGGDRVDGEIVGGGSSRMRGILRH